METDEKKRTINSIRQICNITDEEELMRLMAQFDEELEERLEILRNLLDSNIRTSVVDTDAHSWLVESWRARLVQYYSFAVAFVEHAKSEVFLKPKEKGVTEDDRKAHLRHLAAGFEAMKVKLEGLIHCVDSRVNLCKKTGGIEATGANYGRKTIPGAR